MKISAVLSPFYYPAALILSKSIPGTAPTLKRLVAGNPDTFSHTDAQNDLNQFSKSLQFSAKSIGFAEDKPAAKLFQHFKGKRISSASGFNTLEVNGVKLKKYLTPNNADQNTVIEKVRKQIQSALALTDNTKKAGESYNEDVKAINQAIMDENFSYNARAMFKHIQGMKSDIETAFNKQFDEDKKRLEELFEDADFKKDFMSTLSISEDEFLQVKEDMIAHIETNHTEKTKELMESLINNQALLQDELAAEESRITLLAMLRRNNAAMKAEMDAFSQANPEGEVSASLSQEQNTANLKGITINSLRTLQTLTGLQIIRNADNSYTMTLPRLLGHYAYHKGWNHKLKDDMQSLAMVVRASGYKKISISVQHKDPKEAQRLGREAYEACRNVGFSSDNITINVNGAEVKLEDLFKEHHQLRSAIEKEANQIQQKPNPPKLKADQNDVVRFQKELKALKEITGKEASQNLESTEPVPSRTNQTP